MIVNQFQMGASKSRGAWLAQLEELVILDRGIVSLVPTLGVEIA